jgi:hypothetical protein
MPPFPRIASRRLVLKPVAGSPRRAPPHAQPFYPTLMHPLIRSYDELRQSLRQFVDVCLLESMAPSLMKQFTQVSQTFETFCGLSSGLVHAVVAKMRTRGTSSMFRTGRRLITEWADFVAVFNRLVSYRLSPQLELFATLFTSLLAQLNEFELLFRAGSFDTLISPASFDRIRAEVIAMRKEANAAHRLAKTPRSAEFDQRDFGRRILALGNGIAKIFRLSVPVVVMVTAEVMRLRTNLKAICDDLTRTGGATCIFDDNAAQTRFHIAQTSQEFNCVFKALNLPLEVQLQFLDEEDAGASPDAPREDPLKAEVAEKIDTMCEHIHDLSGVIESAGHMLVIKPL